MPSKALDGGFEDGDEGVDILLSVADAQERLTQARSNYCTALYQYNLYRAALEKAMGMPVGFDAAVYDEAAQMGASADKALEQAEKFLQEEEEEEISRRQAAQEASSAPV